MEQQKRRIKCQVFSRVVGYYQPVSGWNVGKQQEYKERRTYVVVEPDGLDVELLDAEPVGWGGPDA